MRNACPVLEPVLACQHELDVGKRGVDALGAKGLDAILGLLPQLLERGARGKLRSGIGHGDLLSMLPVSACRAERRSEVVDPAMPGGLSPSRGRGAPWVRRSSLPQRLLGTNAVSSRRFLENLVAWEIGGC